MRPSRENNNLACHVGARLRALRAEAGLTQEALAWAGDLSKGYLSRVESGACTPSLDVLQRLAVCLHVELVDLVALEPLSPRAALLEAARLRDRVRLQRALADLDLADAPREDRHASEPSPVSKRRG